MSEVPEDVKVAANVAFNLSYKNGEVDVYAALERAILAERRRCAEMARTLPLCRLKTVSPSGGVTLEMAFGVGAEAQRAAIAEAIESGQ